VRAAIHTLGGFSAHSGQTGLLNWAAPYQQLKPRMFITHGEDMPRFALRDQLKNRLGLEAATPYYGNQVEL
jgi:metallo-beta-lactamase family protein